MLYGADFVRFRALSTRNTVVMDRRNDNWGKSGQGLVESMNDSPQVTVVCDSKKVRETLSGYLRGAEYGVTTFEDDRAYWQQVTAEKIPDLLVLDVSSSMTKRDGLLPQKYGNLPEFPVLALSNPVTNVNRSKYPDSVSWLTKPVRRDEFLESIQATVTHDRAQSAETARDESASASGSAGLETIQTGDSSATDVTGVQTSSGEQAGSALPDRTRPAEKEVVDSRLSRLQTQIQDLEREVDSLQESRGGDEELAQLETELNEVSEEVSALGDHVGTLYDRISALEENFNQIQSTVQNLNAGLETLTNEQVMLADEVESVTRDQADIRSVVDELVQWQQNVSTAFSTLPEEE